MRYSLNELMFVVFQEQYQSLGEGSEEGMEFLSGVCCSSSDGKRNDYVDCEILEDWVKSQLAMFIPCGSSDLFLGAVLVSCDLEELRKDIMNFIIHEKDLYLPTEAEPEPSFDAHELARK